MKSFIAILALVALAAADVPYQRSIDGDAVIVEQDADVFPDQYQYKYKTSNGISAEESGILKNPGQENEGIAVQGANSYVGTDGKTYTITYTADENGYNPSGDHIPTPVPIPDYILRAIAYNAANAKPEAPYKN